MNTERFRASALSTFIIEFQGEGETPDSAQVMAKLNHCYFLNRRAMLDSAQVMSKLNHCNSLNRGDA